MLCNRHIQLNRYLAKYCVLEKGHTGRHHFEERKSVFPAKEKKEGKSLVDTKYEGSWAQQEQDGESYVDRSNEPAWKSLYPGAVKLGEKRE